MDVTDKRRSPEEAALQRYYKTLLRRITNPVDLADLLFSKGIIIDETRYLVRSQRVRSHGTETILAAVQRKLAQSTERENVMSTFCSTLKSSGVDTRHVDNFLHIEDFIAGEYTRMYPLMPA